MEKPIGFALILMLLSTICLADNLRDIYSTMSDASTMAYNRDTRYDTNQYQPAWNNAINFINQRKQLGIQQQMLDEMKRHDAYMENAYQQRQENVVENDSFRKNNERLCDDKCEQDLKNIHFNSRPVHVEIPVEGQ